MTSFIDFDKLPGIYIIINLDNNHRYIGSSVDVRRRCKDHIYQLRHGRHCNSYLQRAFDKYGENNFSIELLKYVSISDLRAMESYFINKLNPEYNLTTYCGQSQVLSEETKRKISISNSNPSREIKLKKLNRFNGTLGIYTLDGGFVKSFNFREDISNYLKCSKCAVSHSLNNKGIIQNKYFILRREDHSIPLKDYEITKRYNYSHTKKPIKLFKNNQLIGVFESTTETAKFLNKHRGVVKDWLHGVKNSREGYTLKFV